MPAHAASIWSTQWCVCRQAGQRGGHQFIISGSRRRHSGVPGRRYSWTGFHHRALPRRRSELRHHWHGCGQEPRFPARCLLGICGHIIGAWMPRMARWPPMAGKSCLATRSLTWPRSLKDYGVEGVIYTDIGRDGMLSGINIEATVVGSGLDHSRDCLWACPTSRTPKPLCAESDPAWKA